MVVSRVRGCATSLCQSSGRYPPPHRILKGIFSDARTFDYFISFASNASLAIGFLLMFAGLAVVVPVLAHSTWHLYRKVVEPAASR